jgi:hypothetical protein
MALEQDHTRYHLCIDDKAQDPFAIHPERTGRVSTSPVNSRGPSPES